MWVVGGGIVVVLLVGLCFGLRRARKRTMSTMVLLCVGGALVVSREAPALESGGDRGILTTTRPGVNCCGVNSLAFALRWIGAQPTVHELTEGISPGPSGECSLTDLYEEARRWGVGAAPVQGATIRAVGHHLARRGRAAVLFLDTGAGGHFLTACGAREGELLVSDFPVKPKFVPIAKLEPLFESGGGVALLLWVLDEKRGTAGLKFVLERIVIPCLCVIVVLCAMGAWRERRRRMPVGDTGNGVE